jgi:hypothetical protein
MNHFSDLERPLSQRAAIARRKALEYSLNRAGASLGESCSSERCNETGARVPSRYVGLFYLRGAMCPGPAPEHGCPA